MIDLPVLFLLIAAIEPNATIIDKIRKEKLIIYFDKTIDLKSR